MAPSSGRNPLKANFHYVAGTAEKRKFSRGFPDEAFPIFSLREAENFFSPVLQSEWVSLEAKKSFQFFLFRRKKVKRKNNFNHLPSTMSGKMEGKEKLEHWKMLNVRVFLCSDFSLKLFRVLRSLKKAIFWWLAGKFKAENSERK